MGTCGLGTGYGNALPAYLPCLPPVPPASRFASPEPWLTKAHLASAQRAAGREIIIIS